MHSLQILAKKLSFEGARTVSKARETDECVRSRMNEVSQESINFPGGGGQTPILDLTGMLVVTFRG